MAQHDFVISNQGFPATRADINNFLQAVASTHSGTTTPTGAVAGTIWLDTTSATAPILKYYDGVDNITLATIDHVANTVNFSDSALDLITDTTPQLGGNLDVNGQSIVSVSNGNITLAPNGTGTVTVTGKLSVDGGTIKLDGNYPVGTSNVALGDGALDDASLTGGCNTAIGTSALTANTTGCCSVAIGNNAGAGLTTGGRIIAIGADALCANTTAIDNLAIGRASLFSNITGTGNVAIGNSTLVNNTASNNVAIGLEVLSANTTGCLNTGIGFCVMICNTTGSTNTAVGANALRANTTASNNTAIGFEALCATTTGVRNVAVGSSAGKANTGTDNTFVGFDAGKANTSGANNAYFGSTTGQATTTAGSNSGFGVEALYNNTTGSCNTAVGRVALLCNTTGGGNTAIGHCSIFSNTTGVNNTAVGWYSACNLTTGDANVVIGRGSGTDAMINLTTQSFRAVFGHNEITNAYVKVAFTVTSDCRDKMNIATIPHGLCFVKQLNPVSFQFKKDRNTEVPHGNKRYGFLAQDIITLEGDNPVIIDNENPDSLKYQGEALVPVLVNAIKELTAKVEELENK